MAKEKRTYEEQKEFLDKAREVYEKNKEEILGILEKCYKESFSAMGLSGHTDRLYLSDTGYTVCENMSQGTFTMESYEDREICVLSVPSCNDVDKICNDNLENVLLQSYIVKVDLENKIKEAKENILRTKHEEEEEDIEEWEIIEEIQFCSEYETSRENYISECIEESWESSVEFFEDKIYNSLKEEMQHAEMQEKGCE